MFETDSEATLPQNLSANETAAHKYLARDWGVVSLTVGGKKLAAASLDESRVTTANIQSALSPNHNIGIRLGAESAGLIDADLDWPEARMLASMVLGELGEVPRFGRKGHEPGHMLFSSPELRTKKFLLPKAIVDEIGADRLPGPHTACILELRNNGHVVAPPSVHENGDPVVWVKDCNPPTVDSDLLVRIGGALAVLSLVLRFYPEQGSRDEVCMALSGALTAAGFDPGSVDHWVTSLAQMADDEEWESRGKGLQSVLAQANGTPTTGLPRLVELLGLPEACVSLFAKWLMLRKNERQVMAGDGHRFRKCPTASIRTGLEALGVTLKFNRQSGKVEVSGLDGFGPTLDEATLIRIRSQLDQKVGFLPPKDLLADVIMDVARDYEYNPLFDHLYALKWDGISRLDTWTHVYLGAVDTPLNRAIGRCILVAAVRRVRKPGTKFDYLPVLEGAQGSRKSSTIRILALRDEYFTDDVPINRDSREMLEALDGVWIGEIGELAALRRAEIEHVKAMLSKQSDKARMAYARFPTNKPRSFILIGTTNSSQYLTDQTGNRRFLPIRVGDIDLDALRRDIDQLWAEAFAAEAKGEDIFLSPELEEQIAFEQSARVADDAWAIQLETCLGDINGKIRSTDLLRIIGRTVERASPEDSRRIGEAMRRLGWRREKQRFSGPPVWSYVRGEFKRGSHIPEITVSVEFDGSGESPRIHVGHEGEI